jgi:hypothetical protein
MKVIKTIEEFKDIIAIKQINLEKLFYDKGCDWDYTAKTFEEIGADELDIIEVIMDLERIMDCVIEDDLGELIMIGNPNEYILSIRRQKKLDELGI